jgi:hypothetical protein
LVIKSDIRPSSEPIGELDVALGTRDDNPRLPLQYQAFKKWSPRFVWNGHDADRALWQGLGLEVFEDSRDKTG